LNQEQDLPLVKEKTCPNDGAILILLEMINGPKYSAPPVEGSTSAVERTLFDSFWIAVCPDCRQKYRMYERTFEVPRVSK
jgi:hypothetical protein